MGSVGGGIAISNNDVLTDLGGLSRITSAEYLFVNNNPMLLSLEGLGGMESVNDRVFIALNAALTSVDGLDRLTSIGEDLIISGNALLTNVDGLSALTFVGRNVSVRSNSALTNLDGLSGLTGADGSGKTTAETRLVSEIGVTDNVRLVRCAVGLGPILTADQADPSVIDGDKTFSGNAADGDCNSEADILTAFGMLTSREDLLTNASQVLAVSPNPVAGSSTLHFALSGTEWAALVVYDALGREVMRPFMGRAVGRQRVTLNAAELPAGFYVTRLTEGDRIETASFAVVR